MSDHDRIWLQPKCCVDPGAGRLWCQDPVWPESDDCTKEGVAYLRADAVAAGFWTPLSKSHPPVDQQVLVRQRDAVGGFVCDVACFIGKQPDGEMRWIMADIRLESRQITHWAEIFPIEVG